MSTGLASLSLFDISEYGANISRESLVFMARMAESSERYDDMSKIMYSLVKLVVPASGDLTIEERNLLSVAYKNVVGSRRASWRTLQTLEESSKQSETEPLVKISQSYRFQIENELETICRQVLDLLEKRLTQLPDNETNDEAKVFYLKMTADYYRYMAEFRPRPKGQPITPESNEAKADVFYGKAKVVAEDRLPATHPIRLGLALNYSVCFYEILQQPKAACSLAKTAFDEAIKKLDTLDEASYKDSTLIMQLLRDNLTLWTQDQNDGTQVEDVHDK